MEYSIAIEIYVGRKLDFMSDVLLQDDGDGVYISEWNITDKPKPTMEQLDAFRYKAELILEQEKLIVQGNETMLNTIARGAFFYNDYSDDIETIIQNAKNTIKGLINGD